MTVTFLIDNIKMRRTGISYPFVLEVPEFGQIAGRVTETQRGATQVAFPSGVKAASTTAGFILYEFQKQVSEFDGKTNQYSIPKYTPGNGGQGGCDGNRLYATIYSRRGGEGCATQLVAVKK